MEEVYRVQSGFCWRGEEAVVLTKLPVRCAQEMSGVQLDTGGGFGRRGLAGEGNLSLHQRMVCTAELQDQMQHCGEKGRSLGHAAIQRWGSRAGEVSRGDQGAACLPGGRKGERVWGH